MFDSLGNLLVGIGGLLVGIAAVVSLVISHRARREAAEAKAVSPSAVLEGLQVQVQAILEAHEEAIRRHQVERDGMEKALRAERARADGAELVGLQLQGRLAESSIDLAAVRAEVADLRARFEASIA